VNRASAAERRRMRAAAKLHELRKGDSLEAQYVKDSPGKMADNEFEEFKETGKRNFKTHTNKGYEEVEEITKEYDGSPFRNYAHDSLMFDAENSPPNRKTGALMNPDHTQLEI
jgi:hypothetical protein